MHTAHAQLATGLACEDGHPQQGAQNIEGCKAGVLHVPHASHEWGKGPAGLPGRSEPWRVYDRCRLPDRPHLMIGTKRASTIVLPPYLA